MTKETTKKRSAERLRALPQMERLRPTHYERHERKRTRAMRHYSRRG